MRWRILWLLWYQWAQNYGFGVFFSLVLSSGQITRNQGREEETKEKLIIISPKQKHTGAYIESEARKVWICDVCPLLVIQVSGTYSKDITFFLGRPVWKVTFRVYYLLTERELCSEVSMTEAKFSTFSSQNFLLKITSLVHSKCWRMTTWSILVNCWTFFLTKNYFYPFVLLKMPLPFVF